MLILIKETDHTLLSDTNDSASADAPQTSLGRIELKTA